MNSEYSIGAVKMECSAAANCQSYRRVIFLLLTAFLASACGLGMSLQERLERGQAAYDEGAYQAAVIDAKNVLKEQSDNVAGRLLLGRALVGIGDGVSAENELLKAVKLGVERTDIAVDFGQALLLQAKFDEVIAEITPDLIDAHPDRLILMRLRGRALLGLQDPVAAREYYVAVLAIDENDVEAQLGIVQTYVAEQNLWQARETLDHVLSSFDDNVSAWLISGSLSMQLQNAERAQNDFAKAAELSAAESDVPNEMRALSGLAEAALSQGQADDVRPTLARMLQIAAEDTRTLLISARVAVLDKDWAKAQRELQEILRRSPGYRPAQMLLGVVHKESGNLGQAEMYLASVVAALPDNANARRLLAETRLQMNKLTEARRVLDPIVTSSDADPTSLSMAASASIYLGEFDEAVEFLQRGLALSPQDVDLQLQLAFAYLRSGDTGQAQQILETISVEGTGGSEFRRDSLLVLTEMLKGNRSTMLKEAMALQARWPDRVESHILVGSIEMSNGDFPAARKSFELSVEIAPDDLRPIRGLAQLDLASGDIAAARERYLRIIELQPQDALSMVALARIAAHGEDMEEARTWLERARKADAAAVAPRRILAALYIASGDYSDAENIAEEAVNIRPDNAVLHNLLGLARANQEDYRGAVLSFKQAMKLDPEDSTYRLNLARAQVNTGSIDAARDILQDASDQDLQDVPTVIMLASLKAQAGDLDGATAIAKQLRERHADDASTHALEAELLARSGKLRDASQAYDRALAIDNLAQYAVRAYQIRQQAGLEDQVAPLVGFLQERPMDSRMRMYLALAYQELNQTDNANREYEGVLENEPDNFIAANNLAWSYFEIGDPRAEAMARRAFEIQPDDSSVADTLGWILVRDGQVDEGVALLRKATEQGDSSAQVRYHLAAGLAAAGDPDGARRILQELLSGQDEFSGRQEAEALLSTLR